jgi:hypothetical protein
LPAQGDLTLEGVVGHFLHAHHLAGQESDFVVGALSPSPSLIRIANGLVKRDLSAAWIGDHAAFERFQLYYHSASVPNTVALADREDVEVASRMTDAFERLIRSGDVATVGEFVVSVMSQANGFCCAPAAAVFPVDGYGFSILVPKCPGVGAIGVYFDPGDVGALYHPKEAELAIVYVDVSHNQFIERVRREWGIELRGVRFG